MHVSRLSLCLQVYHGDLSTVQTSGNLFWPRVLLEGSGDRDGDGNADGKMTCSDPIDCTQKCAYLERTSRHGAGAPPTCAMCNQASPIAMPVTLENTLTIAIPLLAVL